jgi:hypothetical protein
MCIVFLFDYHNTIYKNTEGSFGQWKRFVAGVKAFAERTFKK